VLSGSVKSVAEIFHLFESTARFTYLAEEKLSQLVQVLSPPLFHLFLNVILLYFFFTSDGG